MRLSRATRVFVLVLLFVLAVPLLVAVGLGGLAGRIAWNARSGQPLESRVPLRPAPHTEASLEARLAARGDAGARGAGQRTILFGDLHVHTSHSADAQLQRIVLGVRESDRGPADACDFARFCSQVDFWSINDHAESLLPSSWQSTVEAIRECNALAGDPADPDLVSFLGWEWTQQDFDPGRHYGHKNVVLAGLSDEEIPARPIAFMAGPHVAFALMGAVGPFAKGHDFSGFRDFHRWTMDQFGVEDCSPDTPVRDLPPDCHESATTPSALFGKLDEWGHRALVIPHGLSWGVTNPAHADLRVQLEQHDPARQRLIEIYSGHGNSEVYRDFERPTRDADGQWSCPPFDPTLGVELCCHRAERLARARCASPETAACDAVVQEAIRVAAESDASMSLPYSAVPDALPEEWGDCSQLGADAFLPAFNYRPRQSAQYALAIGQPDGGGGADRFRFGFIGSSDNHRGRAGTGYKEMGRLIMTDGVGYPLPFDVLDVRDGSYYYTGGLAAVHAEGRDREAIFSALERRETYATSGDRILLWFDWIGASGDNGDTIQRPMGSEVVTDASPRFRARALGAFEQKPGCPAFVHAALDADRIESLCLGECFHPSEIRKTIDRIEVVRIRPGAESTSGVGPRIEDPWLRFDCPEGEEGCLFEFEDLEYAQSPVETAYYVRAVQSESLAVNGDPLRCERDAEGRCLRARACAGDAGGAIDDCLDPVGERAWSSPIFLTPSRRGFAGPSTGPTQTRLARSPQ